MGTFHEPSDQGDVRRTGVAVGGWAPGVGAKHVLAGILHLTHSFPLACLIFSLTSHHRTR
jgi:hypothetical protein